ncbi:hypothetical protein HD806DRAFT_501921 [Xylariaceae sp. AK1471]|nr:hypothetical protein HD806DRAFT_501921 [Xylariaceae sp. AK1471]
MAAWGRLSIVIIPPCFVCEAWHHDVADPATWCGRIVYFLGTTSETSSRPAGLAEVFPRLSPIRLPSKHRRGKNPGKEMDE